MQNKRKREGIFTFKRKPLVAWNYRHKVLETVLTQPPAKTTDKLGQGAKSKYT